MSTSGCLIIQISPPGLYSYCTEPKSWMFVCDVSQVQVGTSHQDQRVVGYLTSTHLHAIEGTVQTISLSLSRSHSRSLSSPGSFHLACIKTYKRTNPERGGGAFLFRPTADSGGGVVAETNGGQCKKGEQAWRGPGGMF